MCGIVGILGTTPVAPLLLDSLKRLEYRGYDSAGIATIEDDGHLHRRRAEGKLYRLADRLATDPLSGRSGIGHTRWATHGKPTEKNAHPHATERVAVVHNGIIENFRELREEVEAMGRVMSSDTDTEVIAHLITLSLELDHMKPVDAFAAVLGRLRGAFALAVLFDGEEDLLVAARRGSPLAIGHGHGEIYVGSDAIALAPLTDAVTYLEDGDYAVLTRRAVEIFNEHGQRVHRTQVKSIGTSLMVDKGNHRHFMAKEIAEQPEVVGHTLAHYLDLVESKVALPENLQELDFAAIDRVAITACGTAYYAGLVGKYWFEQLARLPVDIDVASEFRYREAPMAKGGLTIVVSQSGETADTLASLRYAKSQGQQVAAILNVRGSTIGRESDFVLPTLAGPEIGVASTKAFTCQLAVLAALVIAAGKQRGVISDAQEAELVRGLSEVPRLMSLALHLEEQIERLAREEISRVRHVLYLGRGTSYPMALEGALKLKEISYLHAEGYAAGELKHGPIALIDEEMPVVVIAPHDKWFDKTVSNMQEVVARGGRIVMITDQEGCASAPAEVAEVLVLRDAPMMGWPFISAVAVQLLAYHTAVAIGTDVDQPRNLAKSVTVE